MSDDDKSCCQQLYLNCCKLFVALIFIAAIYLTIIFTPSNPIFRSAYNGDIVTIQKYLAEGSDINALDKWNNTALHWAAKGNNYQIVKLLVDNGIDVQAVNEQGDTALHWSVYSNNETIIEYLVMQYVDVDCINNEGETPLHMAIMFNAFKSARALLNLHANPNIVTKEGNAPLHYISPTCAEDETCRNLIEEFKRAGCDLTLRNAKNISVLEAITRNKVPSDSDLYMILLLISNQ